MSGRSCGGDGKGSGWWDDTSDTRESKHEGPLPWRRRVSPSDRGGTASVAHKWQESPGKSGRDHYGSDYRDRGTSCESG